MSDLPWPDPAPSHETVVLRAFGERDVAMVRELSTDPYVPLVGTLPAHASESEAGEWITRQQGRLAEGIGFSFCIADRASGRGLGSVGLWLSGMGQGRATAGYAVVPSERGRGVNAQALTALARFAWTIGALHRVEAYIEPWNVGSLAAAQRAGFELEGLLRSHQEIGGRRVDMLLAAAIRPADQQQDGSRSG